MFLAGERVGSAGILLSWNTPPLPNGRIIAYIVKYKEVCPWMQNTYTQVTTKPDSLEVLLTNLNPGTTYEIQVTCLVCLLIIVNCKVKYSIFKANPLMTQFSWLIQPSKKKY